MRRPIATILTVLGCVHILYAQQTDSIPQLETVNVYGMSATQFLSGTKSVKADSLFLQSQSNALVSESLQLLSPMYFRNRGAGMLSSISLRGTSPQHTNVLWNGLQINSFSLGQMDFSLLPVAAFSSMELHLGGGSTQFGSGAIGGSLLLGSRLNQANGYGGNVSMGVGSFGQRNARIGAYYADEKWELMLNSYYLSAENNFKVRPQGYEQPNAAWAQKGVLLSTAYHFSATSNLELSIWQHQADREVQLPIGSMTGGNFQEDRNQRLSLKFNKQYAFGQSYIQTGYVKDQIIFNGSGGDIERYILKSAHHWRLPLDAQMKLEGEWNRILGHLENYGNTVVEDRIDLSLSLLKSWENGASISVNSRKPWVSDYETPLLYFVGANWPVFKFGRQNVLGVNASFSNNFRVPTLNDRFWLNSGRPDLKAEKSLNMELGVSFKQAKDELVNISFYRYLVDDWIQWVPTSANVWRPENVKQVLSQGVEVSSEKNYNFGIYAFKSRLHYGYTSSVVRESADERLHRLGKQLIYTPLHQAGLNQHLAFNQFLFQINMNWTALRYTTTDNSADFALNGFTLLNASMTYYLKLKNHHMDIQLQGNNLTNSNYQLFINHAMPGINYVLQINYKLNKRK